MRQALINPLFRSQPDGQLRVICASSPRANDNSINAIAEIVDPHTRSRSTNPVSISCTRRQFPIQSHGPLSSDIRPLPGNKSGKGAHEFLSFLVFASPDTYTTISHHCIHTLPTD